VAAALAAAWQDIAGARRVVVCHNGWGSASHFADHLPADRVYSARVITGFHRRLPNAVEITAHAEPIRIGSLYGADLAPVGALCDAIARGGVPCEVSDDIECELWSKMLYNCALNPLGALIGVAYGELARHPETRSILEATIVEIFGLLAATGRRTRWRDASEYLRVFWDELLPPTAAHESSMLQDLRAGRRTEVDALNGAVVALAAECGLDVPVNRALLSLIRAREAQRARAH
jgi:2-dehydropantoate 2-reductase